MYIYICIYVCKYIYILNYQLPLGIAKTTPNMITKAIQKKLDFTDEHLHLVDGRNPALVVLLSHYHSNPGNVS